ncbi:DUF6480 family protein [Frankia sp. QA3]|uniref:DUF6480 family protein n=1 Tax=Frankia sp. QA3 TaxID=710111 RepID=UPI000269BF29|nr:DUF6480 family protein [Frankia sp. QA3]EIV91498.1 hypothetical protein FraQA3DRAFT_0953 [Frankia sp. QA3]
MTPDQNHLVRSGPEPAGPAHAHAHARAGARSRAAGSPVDPDPARTPGLEPGGGVPPGETPPAEDSTGGAVSGEQPNADPGTPNRTPMMITLIAVGVVVLLVAGFFLAEAVVHAV